MLTSWQYCDSITTEGLEFSVGTKNNWEIKEFLWDDERPPIVYRHENDSEDLQSLYNQAMP